MHNDRIWRKKADKKRIRIDVFIGIFAISLFLLFWVGGEMALLPW